MLCDIVSRSGTGVVAVSVPRLLSIAVLSPPSPVSYIHVESAVNLTRGSL
jgi:hypothetical protein